MVPVRLKGLGMVVAMVALASVGCCAKYKTQIDLLEGKLEGTDALKSDLEAQLSRARTNEQTMRTQYDSAQDDLARANAKIADLEANGGGTGTGGGGTEEAIFTETLGSDVLFSSGRATLTAAGKTALAATAAKIKSDFPTNTVRVYGHTDNDPIKKTKNLWADNLDLSANRAMAVARYLVFKGLTASKVETVAMGQTRPIADNKTTAGKAKNRRVEIVVVK